MWLSGDRWLSAIGVEGELWKMPRVQCDNVGRIVETAEKEKSVD